MGGGGTEGWGGVVVRGKAVRGGDWAEEALERFKVEGGRKLGHN